MGKLIHHNVSISSVIAESHITVILDANNKENCLSYIQEHCIYVYVRPLTTVLEI